MSQNAVVLHNYVTSPFPNQILIMYLAKCYERNLYLSNACFKIKANVSMVCLCKLLLINVICLV